MKKYYEEPEFEVINFEATDVITASYAGGEGGEEDPFDEL